MPGLSRVYYSSSGSEANEKAFKMVLPPLLYIYTHTYIYIYNIYTHTYTHAYAHAYIHIYAHINMYTYT